jgi:hypothetical protein
VVQLNLCWRLPWAHVRLLLYGMCGSPHPDACLHSARKQSDHRGAQLGGGGDSQSQFGLSGVLHTAAAPVQQCRLSSRCVGLRAGPLIACLLVGAGAFGTCELAGHICSVPCLWLHGIAVWLLL